MVIQWWIPILIAAILTVSFSFWGWLAVKVIEQGAKIADIESRIGNREVECKTRMEWLQRMDDKLNKVREDVASIRGALEHSGIERRQRRGEES
jgi:hypothetical protein